MPLFNSFFLGGFECSTHKRGFDHVRLDMIASSGHDVQAERDYGLLAAHGLLAARDGLRWHLIERRHSQYDWSSLLPQLRAARRAGVQVIWDLFHYGWPSGVDPFAPGMVDRFASFARAAAAVVQGETDGTPWFCPVNEISFLAWAGGDTGGMNPFARGRGVELKAQLVRMAIAATEAVRDVIPAARFLAAEPLIQIAPRSSVPFDVEAAALHVEGQYEAVDMLIGAKSPELGGKPDYLDVCGQNYYAGNQWVDGVGTINPGHHTYMPLSDLLARTYARYGRPLLIAETGTEASFRAPWLHYIADEVATARARGLPVEGICLYPILSHRGWDDNRHCPNGMFEAFTPDGDRTVHQPLADELARQQVRLASQPQPG